MDSLLSISLGTAATQLHVYVLLLGRIGDNLC